MTRPSNATRECPTLAIDFVEAQRFLDLLAPDEDVTFQTFPDSVALKGQKNLIRVLHGRLSKYAGELKRLNQGGAGIFVMVNAGDGIVHEGEKSCRTTKSVTRVRANFVDLDGSPLEPVLEGPVAPSVIVSSSPGRWHAYWLVDGEDLEQFTPTQVQLIERFKADLSVKDLPRIMRAPGFLHQKDAPYLVNIVSPKAGGKA